MPEKTRRLKDPIPQEDGSILIESFMTPVSFDIRGEALIGSRKVIPVVFVPGTMGTNLRVRKDIGCNFRSFQSAGSLVASKPPGLPATEYMATCAPVEPYRKGMK